MSTALGQFAASSRTLPLRKRDDLVAFPVQFGDRRYWNVKDPLTLRYYQLRDEEFSILQMLDGRISLDEIQARFERRFAPVRLRLAQLQQFLEVLHGQGLLVAQTLGQGERLLERARKLRREQWLSSWSNLLALRFRGVDPERFLNWLSPRCRWLFSRPAQFAALALVAAALCLVAVEFQTFRDRLPELGEFLNLHNLPWLLVALALTKIVHELGHALTLKRYGGECHEIGLMLLVFTPCLYANVSDAWLLRNKWQRIAVSGAGIAVEVVLAAACTFLWWFSQPGLFNSLCLNLAVVCSVSSLLFNGNPLLRYDGYYVLADWLEIPNLQANASALLRHRLLRWFCGESVAVPPFLPNRRQRTLLAYAVASTFYRIVIVAGILWFLYNVLEPRGLEVVAQAVAASVVCVFLIPLAVRGVRFARDPVHIRGVERGRLVSRGMVAAALLTGLLLVPLPAWLEAPLVLEPASVERIYVTVPGRLLWTVPAGTQVRAGEVVAELDNPQLRLDVARLEGELARHKLQVQLLQTQRLIDRQASQRLPAAERAVQGLVERLSQRRADERRLQLRADSNGTVISPPATSAQAESGNLPFWAGTPLEPGNRCGYLSTGTLLCLIGDPADLKALLIVDQSDVNLVEVGQRVRMQLHELPGNVLEGAVDEVARIDVQVAPDPLRALLPSRADAAGAARPARTSYQVRVAVEPHMHGLPVRSTGTARIQVAPRSLWSRGYRTVCRTFGW